MSAHIKTIKQKNVHLNSYNNVKIVKKPQKFQNAHSRLQWEHTQIFQGFVTIFIVFSILTRLSLRVFILTFMKTILYWTHIVPSFANSKNLVLPRFDEIHTFRSIYPLSKIEILDRWEFLQYGHMIHHWNRNKVIHKCFNAMNRYH